MSFKSSRPRSRSDSIDASAISAPITPPYDRLPQVTGRYARYDVGGLDFSVDADYTHFSADRNLTRQPNARRSFLLGQISRPWLRPGWFFTPKMQLNATAYQFDQALANGETTAQRPSSARSLPWA